MVKIWTNPVSHPLLKLLQFFTLVSTDAAVSKATSVVHGIVGGVPIPFPLDNPDACKGCGLQCPLKKNVPYKYTNHIFIKTEYPDVSTCCPLSLFGI